MATATPDWAQCSAVESIPGKVSGAWVFKDTRMPVSLVFENLEAGATIDEIMEWFHLGAGTCCESAFANRGGGGYGPAAGREVYRTLGASIRGSSRVIKLKRISEAIGEIVVQKYITAGEFGQLLLRM